MSLEELKSKLGLGARANKYMIAIPYGDGNTMDTLAKGTSLPDVTLGTVEVWNKGRKMMVAGETQYAGTWDVTFYNTEGLDIKKLFEDEIDRIDSYLTETKSVTGNADYMNDLTVMQLNSQNEVTSTYVLHNAYPTVVSAVDLAADSADTISEVTVTFAYSHWERTA